jgi:hypothetical protein
MAGTSLFKIGNYVPASLQTEPKTSELKMQLELDHQRFLTPWITVASPNSQKYLSNLEFRL